MISRSVSFVELSTNLPKKDKPIWIIGDLDNQHLDKWRCTVLKFTNLWWWYDFKACLNVTQIKLVLINTHSSHVYKCICYENGVLVIAVRFCMSRNLAFKWLTFAYADTCEKQP